MTTPLVWIDCEIVCIPKENQLYDPKAKNLRLISRYLFIFNTLKRIRDVYIRSSFRLGTLLEDQYVYTKGGSNGLPSMI